MTFKGVLCCYSRCLAVMFTLVALPACVSPPQEVDSQEVDDAHMQALRTFDNFAVRGGIGIWTESESISASVDWQQMSESLEVKLTAPLGFSSLTLTQQPGKAMLIRGSSEPMVGSSGDTLLQRALGLSAPVPLNQLSQWIRGLPGDASNVTLNGTGQLQSLNYQDATGVSWRAEIRKRTTFQGISLPALITARGGPYNLRLVLKQWSEGAEISPPKPEGPVRITIPKRSSDNA